MEIRIDEGKFLPQIDQLPLDGRDIVVAFETAKIAIDIAKQIGTALVSFARELGIIPDIEITNLGDRAIQAINKGITPEKYGSVQEWVEIIQQDDWGYDQALSNEFSEASKIMMGIGTIAAYIVEKYEELPIKDFVLIAPNILGIFSDDRMMYLAKLVASNSTVVSDVMKYLIGLDKTRPVVENAIEALIAIEKKIDPSLNDNEAYDKVIKY